MRTDVPWLFVLVVLVALMLLYAAYAYPADTSMKPQTVDISVEAE